MNKIIKTLFQLVMFVAVVIIGLILLQLVVNSFYFYPSTMLAVLFPEVSEALTRIWGIGLITTLIAQSLLLLLVGLVYLYRNWLKLRHGRATLRGEITWMCLVIGLCFIVVWVLFSATSYTGGFTPVRLLTLLIFVALGAAQAALSIWKFGPHYESLKQSKE